MPAGNFFEDFEVGQIFVHPTPRTVTSGDVAFYLALTGSRFALNSSDEFARRLGLPSAPVDDWLVFHLVFGKSVAEISLNALANLGYAEGRFLACVHVGDTLSARSTVIGRRETSDGRAGIVWVRTVGANQHHETVLDYVRWVLVAKRDPARCRAVEDVPKLGEAVGVADLHVPAGMDFGAYDRAEAGEARRWGDYEVGERIDHVTGVTVEEAEHQLAARLYQNPAHIHHDRRLAAATRFGRRLVYGGHVISLARALSFNGLANACRIAALNGGRHANPVMAGDTLYAWSEVLSLDTLPGRDDVGAVRLRTIATKDRPCADFPWKSSDDAIDPTVVLALDYVALMPR